MPRTTCIVLDTNLWISRRLLYLNTPLSAAFLYALGQRDGRLGLPEVLETELRKYLPEAAEEQVRRYEDAVASLVNFRLHQGPDAAFQSGGLDGLADQRFDELEEFILRVPLTLDQTRRALCRVNVAMPRSTPNGQQFKDCLLWEAVIDLGRGYNTIFVTGDKGFFSDRKPKRGLADALRKEIDEDESLCITVLYGEEFDELLTGLHDEAPDLRRGSATEALAELAIAKVIELLDRPEWELDDLHVAENEAYVTAKPGETALSFVVRGEVTDLESPNEGARGDLSVSGTCLYSPREQRVERLELSSYTINWRDEDDGLRRSTYWTPDLLKRIEKGEREERVDLPLPWQS